MNTYFVNKASPITSSRRKDGFCTIHPNGGKSYSKGTTILGTNDGQFTVVIRRKNFDSEELYQKEIERYLNEGYGLINGTLSSAFLETLCVNGKIESLLMRLPE